MGVLFPLCVVSEGAHLLAFAKTLSYKDRTISPVYVLVKSNENPSHTLDDLTWTLVSAIETTGYPEILPHSSIRAYPCAVDDTGVFSIFFFALYANPTPVGIQYQPPGINGTTQPAPNTLFGNGNWKNVTFPADYHWQAGARTTLFNYKDPQNKNHLIHAHLNSSSYSSFYVSTLDPTTMMMNQGAAPWGVPSMYYNADEMVSDGKNLYIIGDDSQFYDLSVMFQFPLNSAALTTFPTVAPTRFVFNGTQSGCASFADVFLRRLGDKIAMLCQRNTPSTITIFSGSNTTTILPAVAGGIGSVYDVENLEVVNSSPVPFIFYNNRKGGVFSIPLNGTLVGVSIASKSNVTIVEDYGDFPPFSPTITGISGPISSWGSELGKSGGKSNIGGIVGGVFAVVVVVIAVLVFVFYRRKRQLLQSRGVDKSGPFSSSDESHLKQPLHHQQRQGQEQGQEMSSAAPILYHGQDQYLSKGQTQHTYSHGNNHLNLQSPLSTEVIHGTSTTGGSPLPAYSNILPNAGPPSIPHYTRPFTTQQGFP